MKHKLLFPGKSFLRSFFTFCLFLSFLSLQAASFIGGRTDFRDETIYFVITTRFYDGDPDNNVHCWDGNNPGDPAWRGDFKGLIEKLDYIKALGFTAVWITPIVENASGYDYHGYHAMNHKKVDERYESEDVKFQDLIDAAHARDMKIILDIVLNHTGNFGEEYLCPMFKKEGNLSSVNCMKFHENTTLPANYFSLNSDAQYQTRLARMKNTDGQNHDKNNYWHHYGNFNWDDITAQWGQIAGDCVDLNTENPAVYNYLVEAYSQFIAMGVDGFRIDTGRHISRLVFNKVFNDAFHEAARKAGKTDFFMFAEICTRVREVWNRDQPGISTPFYTWKDSKNYPWSDDPTPYSQIAIYESNFDQAAASLTNQKSCIDNYNDNLSVSAQPTSQNAFLNGNTYRTVDHSMHSGLNVIDFPVHWNFKDAQDAFNIALSGDKYYNDATYNVVYVDSHDYAPDGAPEGQRFNQPQDVWAENLSLMYTFRGIPCVYYGSEIEFKKGYIIDEGPNIKLIDSGRAYFGGYITGDIQVNDFADYTNATGNMSVTLKHPLALHIQRLSKIRMAVPALRKGQYSTEGVSGTLAFKRRYTDATTDSYALVTISGNATFNNIPNGTYTDVVTGDVKTVTNGSLTASVSGKGNIRVYVLTTDKTPAPGKIGTDGKYLYTSSPVTVSQGNYDGKQEALTTDPETDEPGPDPEDPEEPILYEGEYAIFFEKADYWNSTVYTYVYDETSVSNVIEITGSWPGSEMKSLGNNVYKYTFNNPIGEYDKIMFSDGTRQVPGSGESGWQVQNGAYYTVNGVSHILSPISPEDPEEPILYEGEYAIFFEKADYWNSTVYTYVYDETSVSNVIEITGSWPGSEMKSLGNNVYKYTFNNPIGEYDKIMFSDGTRQVPGSGESGWQVQNGAYYTVNGVSHILSPSPTGYIHPEEKNTVIYAYAGNIYVELSADQPVRITYIDGRVIQDSVLPAGINIVSGLSQGVYLVNGKKLFLW
ncbi:MAG: starch-binding protein [Candidatus Azobacteroides sp.]|nr:starch-binding protein [Candidatus Azobacteroides sp.]